MIRWRVAISTLVAGTSPLAAQSCVWEALSGGGLRGSVLVRALAVFDDGAGPALYMGGVFSESAGNPGHNITRWDGRTWSRLGTGTGGLYALTVFDDGTGPALYAGGFFTRAGNIEGHGIARWDGREWFALGSGMFSMGQYGPDHVVKALTVFDDGNGPALYAGGHFDTAGGVPAKSIARWDGQSWSAVGLGLHSRSGDAGEVLALAVYDAGSGPALFAAGIVYPAGASTHGLVRWSGQEWEVVGGGLWGRPEALAVFDDGTGQGLYVGGQLLEVGGGLPVSHIARWDEGGWSALGVGTDYGVRSLGVFDDGRKPALYVGGGFQRAGGVRAWGIARWAPGAPGAWSALGDGLWRTREAPSVNSIHVFDDGTGPALYVGGKFDEAGGIPANSIARWRCPTCAADCDHSTGRNVLDIFDFLCFQNRYAQNNPYACDCDTSTGPDVCDIFDFLCFQNHFVAGCP